MGVGIEAYRIRIGTFNQTKVLSSKSSFMKKEIALQLEIQTRKGDLSVI